VCVGSYLSPEPVGFHYVVSFAQLLTGRVHSTPRGHALMIAQRTALWVRAGTVCPFVFSSVADCDMKFLGHCLDAVPKPSVEMPVDGFHDLDGVSSSLWSFGFDRRQRGTTDA
jgi:hypothetical protein